MFDIKVSILGTQIWQMLAFECIVVFFLICLITSVVEAASGDPLLFLSSTAVASQAFSYHIASE